MLLPLFLGLFTLFLLLLPLFPLLLLFSGIESTTWAPTEAAAPVEALDVSEPFPTAEATRERFPDLPKEFEKIVITKTAIKEGQTSSVAAGAVYEGVLLGDIAEGMSLATTAVSTGKIERDGITQVGPGEFQIETGTSTYRIKKAS